MHARIQDLQVPFPPIDDQFALMTAVFEAARIATSAEALRIVALDRGRSLLGAARHQVNLAAPTPTA